ncbi:MAG: hypothetical protein KC503_40150, partial [Myxococcales bacterium]|nr:hypothetical protein [Myxococcales bacterium]
APVATPAPTEPAAAPAAPAPAATPAAPVAAAPAPAPAPAPAQAASALYMPGYGPPTPAAPVAPAPAAQAAPGYPAGFQTGPQLAHHPMAAPPAPQDPSAYGDLDVYGMPRQRSGGKIFGIFLMLILVGGGLFFLFVLARNDWSLDLANFGAMIDRAFGGSRRHRAGALDIAPGQTQILTLHGKKVLVANGVITNNTTKEHRFIYVLGWIKRGATVMASSGEVPAGNVFTDEQLAKMKPKALRSRLNPAGTDGANRSIATGATIGYQIIFNKLPADYSTDRYRVEVKIARSESGPSSP